MKHDFSDFFPTKKKSKYNNQKEIVDGIAYDSKAEASYAKQLADLSMLPKDKRPVKIERQVEFPIEINGIHIFSYFADFRVTWPGDRVEVIDVKGFQTDVFKIKRKAVEAFYKIKIKIVK